MNPELCIYCNATHTLIDFVRPSETATTALQRLAPHYGSALEVLPIHQASARSDAARVTQPGEITAEQFHEMLNILPPVGWANHGSSESFKMSELLSGLITGIYVRLGDRYFSFNDSIRLTHEACCDKTRASPAYEAEPSRS